MFYDNFIALCAKKGVSASGAAKAIGLSNAAASGWKAGKQPSEITLNKLALFFNVPVSALTDEKETPPPEAEAIGPNKRALIDFIMGLDEKESRLCRSIVESVVKNYRETLGK